VAPLKLVAAMAAGSAVLAGPAMAADHQGWKTTADVGEAGLVALALGKSAADRDWDGTRELALTLGATAGTTYALKHIFPETRPDGSDNRSFPSGHTSISFAAAGYLQQRYGWEWGLPATAAAALVGVSRVESKDHHWYDVVVGAAIGEGAAFLLTSPRDSQVRVFPWGDTHGGGLAVAARF
jgi:membrane-associated phospholipid phosphatase